MSTPEIKYPSQPSPAGQSLSEVVFVVLRLGAAAWALYFAIGYLLWWRDLMLLRVDFFRDGNGMIFPWIFLPLYASAGLAGGFAIWGRGRKDQTGVLGQTAMALCAVYFIGVIAMDLATNQHPHYPAGAKLLNASALALIAASAIRHVRIGPTYSLAPVGRMILSGPLLLLAVLLGDMAIEGFQKAWHDKFDGWGSLTTPVVLVVSGVGAALGIALVSLAWRIQWRAVPHRIARILPAQWNL